MNELNNIIDLSLCVTPKMVSDAQGNSKKAFTGHLGTHFDVMNKVFPLEYTSLPAIVFDVRGKEEISVNDVDMSKICEGMFVAFYTGHIEQYAYGTSEYMHEHPILSIELIDSLLEREVAIIAIDAPGIRRHAEHTPIDQKCADRGAFVVENVCNLGSLCRSNKYAFFRANTYPMNFSGMSGLPCRITATII